ncbi:hypothetical protein HQ520_06890, partial [bacterium]|nr:hypothetical protein [bacterium]
WPSVPVVVAAIPGDWKDQFNAYKAWVKTWNKPLKPRQDWFRNLFSFATYTGHPFGSKLDLLDKAEFIRDQVGYCDYIHIFGWAITTEHGHWGDYDHFDRVVSREFFENQVHKAQAAGVPIGLYLDGYLVSPGSVNLTMDQREEWGIRTSDGELLLNYGGVTYNMCPYVKEWRDYLTDVYVRLVRDIGAKGFYIDEFGRNLSDRTCYSTRHGHPVPMPMAPGEQILLKQIREALPADVATYTEYVPSDVTSQYVDGGYSHVTRYGNYDDYITYAPHFADLQRFALPDVKIFEIYSSTPLGNGNWYPLKYFFFNGNGYYLVIAGNTYADEHARAFLEKVFRIQHAHADAFTSMDVEPLVRTEVPNLFANRFSMPEKTIWTLNNANFRTLRGPLLKVPHRSGARYRDLWNDRIIDAKVEEDTAVLTFEIGPRSVGCIVQERASGAEAGRYFTSSGLLLQTKTGRHCSLIIVD